MKLINPSADGHRTTIERWKSQAWTLIFGILCFALGILFYRWINTPVSEMISPLGDVREIQVYANNPTEDVKTDAEKAIEVWFEEKDWAWAYRVAACESSMNPLAKNPESTASGIFQITKLTWEANKCEGDIFNAWDNAECASKIFDKRGTQPWNASKYCWRGKNES
jgi:hypothetical protein